MWFTFVTAHLLIFLSFQPRLAATLLRSCSAVNSIIRQAGLSPTIQPASLAQRLIDLDPVKLAMILPLPALSRQSEATAEGEGRVWMVRVVTRPWLVSM